MKKLKTFQEAQDFIFSLIPNGSQQLYSGEAGLEKTREFLRLLGNPEKSFKVVHVAGTSGKGSTCWMTSELLRSQGFKVGLHLSPHLLDIRERAMVNGQMVQVDKFVHSLNQLLPTLKKVPLNYFQLLTVLALSIFAQEKVDYAVIEVGLGGLLDATNSMDTQKLDIITRIGFDHTAILGKTLPQIAAQKAGIIQKGNQVLTIKQKPQIMKVFGEAVQKAEAEYQVLEAGKDYSQIQVTPQGTSFTFRNLQVQCGLVGVFQAENCALAWAAVQTLSQRDGWEFHQEPALKALSQTHFPGRLEVRGDIVLDGAHNPQKMKALLETVKQLYPGKKFTFLLAFKKGKNYQEMVEQIIPLAEKIIITSFFKDGNGPQLSEDPQNLEPILLKNKFTHYQLIGPIDKALGIALSLKRPLIITGSLYFMADIYPLLKMLDASDSFDYSS